MNDKYSFSRSVKLLLAVPLSSLLLFVPATAQAIKAENVNPAEVNTETAGDDISVKIDSIKSSIQSLTEKLVTKEVEVFNISENIEMLKSEHSVKIAEIAGIDSELEKHKKSLRNLQEKQLSEREVLSSKVRNLYMAADGNLEQSEWVKLSDLIQNPESFTESSRFENDSVVSDIFQRVYGKNIAVESEVKEKIEEMSVLESKREVLLQEAETTVNNIEDAKFKLSATSVELSALQTEQELWFENLKIYQEEELLREYRKTENVELLKKYLENVKVNTAMFSILSLSSSDWLWPVPGYETVNSPAGPRNHPATGILACHEGVDVPAPSGVPVVAPASGVVVKVQKSNYGYGNYVVVQHDVAVSTLFAHLSSVDVSLGEKVSKGDVLGAIGSTGDSTGPHLHYEVRIDGVPYQPLGWYGGVKENVSC